MVKVYEHQPVMSFLGDLRLDQRFVKIINQLSNDIGKSISQCMLKWSQTKATYRFLSNKKVKHSHLMAIEQEHLIAQLIKGDTPQANGSKRVVLHMQDTTTLNFSEQKSAHQLDCLDYPQHRGYFVHTGLVTDEQGCIEGILAQDIWNRSVLELGTSRYYQSTLQSLPIECKESVRWVEQFDLFDSIVGELKNTRGISISDCESDIYELFIAKRSNHVDLIVRSQHNRDILMPDGKYQGLATYIPNLKVEGHFWMDVLQDNKHSYRPVEVAIRFGEVNIKLPENLKWSSTTPRAARRLAQRMAEKNGLKLRVVHIIELNPILGAKPIEWTLLTTLPINDYWDALQVVQYYALRWRIEIFHLVFKEGCAIEKLQLEKPQRLENAIALYSIVAQQVTSLRYLAQSQGHKPMTLTGFTPKQYLFLAQYLKVNYNFVVYTPQAPQEIPSIEQFVHLIICLAGGHRGNKNKDFGIRQLWKGLSTAKIVLKAYEAFTLFDSA
jgi:Transposase DNA-binding/Transposase DDE domain